jgi:hypothetical protein
MSTPDDLNYRADFLEPPLKVPLVKVYDGEHTLARKRRSNPTFRTIVDLSASRMKVFPGQPVPTGAAAIDEGVENRTMRLFYRFIIPRS